MSKGDISTLPERGHFYFAPTDRYDSLLDNDLLYDRVENDDFVEQLAG